MTVVDSWQKWFVTLFGKVDLFAKVCRSILHACGTILTCYPVNDHRLLPCQPSQAAAPSAGQAIILVLYPVTVKCAAFYSRNSRKCACLIFIHYSCIYIYGYAMHRDLMMHSCKLPFNINLHGIALAAGLTDARTRARNGTASAEAHSRRSPHLRTAACVTFMSVRGMAGANEHATQRSLARAEWWVTYTLPLSSKEAQHREGVTRVELGERCSSGGSSLGFVASSSSFSFLLDAPSCPSLRSSLSILAFPSSKPPSASHHFQPFAERRLWD